MQDHDGISGVEMMGAMFQEMSMVNDLRLGSQETDE
jgi:hypothetical protein